MMKRGRNIVLASAGFGALFWVLDSVFDYYVFHNGPPSLVAAMFTHVPAHDIYLRSVALALFLLFGFVVSGLLRKRLVAASELARAEERLRRDRARAEEALKENERIIAAINQHLPCMFYRARAGHDRAMEFVSDGSRVLLGHAPEDLAGSGKTPFAGLVHPDDRGSVAAELGEAREQGRPYRATYRVRHADGGYRWVLDQGIAIPAVADAIEGVIIDVTEQKRLEEQLLQAQKMEAVGRLAGGVAHDFNNQLTVIMVLSEILLGAIGEKHPNYVDAVEIRKASEKAAALTNQLLAFSRKQIFKLKVLDLNFMVKDIEKMLRRVIGEDIGLETVLDPALAEVRADPSQIEQIIMNLAINARDAMPSGGKITIETGNAVLDQGYAASHVDAVPGPHVMLSLSDTGHGMDPETVSRIFEPFFTTKQLGMGTGLGLSTVYGIVKQSGGNIYVYSEEGRGTTFKVYLPRWEGGPDQDEPDRRPAPAPGGDETILLVEDDEMVRNLARRFLAAAGYRVIEAGSCADAIQKAAGHKHDIHLILTDVVLPDKNGKDLYSVLRQSRPGIKVLYMSGYTDNAIVHHGVIEPGAAFLQKPFTADALAAKVREALAP